MWRLGFFFHEMGFGLLSVFLPLYVVSEALKGSLFDIGIMSAVALLLAIPASLFWGYLCDKTKHYKRFILLSFSSSALLLYLFSLTTNVHLLILLYALMSSLHVAHEPPKNVLIAELYSRADWEKSFAFYEGFTESGWLIGLVLGFLTSAYAISPALTLLLCSVLNLVAFGLSLILVADPLLVFERSLVSIEKSTNFACHGISLASKLLDGIHVNEKLRRENVNAFCWGLVLFSLATSILFTPMPIFASQVVKSAALPSSLVFAFFVLNSAGGVLGYYAAGSRFERQKGKANIGQIVIFRSLLSFLLLAIAAILSPTAGTILLVVILVMMGFANAMFLAYTLSLSMELVPAGKAGLFNVLIGIGGACGSFVGPFIAAQAAGFIYVFLAAGIAFFIAYVAFKAF
jgi:MFS family permease